MAEHSDRLHAVLGPSSAERWIECPASVRLIETLDREDDSGSVWAAEGTRAHSLAEIEASVYFGLMSEEEYRVAREVWLDNAPEEESDGVRDEMEKHALAYVATLADMVEDMGEGTGVFLEQRLQTGVPGCWGTGDAVLVNVAEVRVVDFKYGQGVSVRAEGNPQTRLYGLGALEMFDGVLGDVEKVSMTIFQPRINNVSTEVMTAKALRKWRHDVVLPAARETQNPDARFGPSVSACRWCPASGICAVRKQHVLDMDFGSPNIMDEESLAEAFSRIDEVRAWANDVEKEALSQAYSEGKKLPGYKVVRTGGRRGIIDKEAAIRLLVKAGYKRSEVSRVDTRTLGDLEALVGKARLPEILGETLRAGEGRPALVAEDDPREEISKHDESVRDFSSEASGE